MSVVSAEARLSRRPLSPRDIRAIEIEDLVTLLTIARALRHSDSIAADAVELLEPIVLRAQAKHAFLTTWEAA